MSLTAYECQACGWIYPPNTSLKELASDNMVSSPTPFMDLPDDWQCPLCGVGKTEFKAIQSDATQSASSATSHDISYDEHGNRIKQIGDQVGGRAASHDALSGEPVSSEVVIIGAGLAGWAVVDALRAKDADISITLISADQGDRYHKPMLSVALSQNKSPDDLIRATGQEASEKADIRLLAQTQVLSIDSQNCRVQTDNGDVSYGYLVMAMGATPAMPPSLPADKVWHINDITSFAKIHNALSQQTDTPRHIAVIGAGMVGTEIAEDLCKIGHKVTMLDMADAPLAMMLPKIATDQVVKALHAQGIEFIGGSRVTQVATLSSPSQLTQLGAPDSDESYDSHDNHHHNNNHDGGYQLTYLDKDDQPQTLTVDHILVSTGLKVDAALPTSAGIDFAPRTGIAVSEASLQSSIANIYAIGDCMSINGTPCRYVAPLRAQATSIAEHILGGQQPDYKHSAYTHKPPMIRLKNKSISISATGTPSSDERHGTWQVSSETSSDTACEMVLEQIADDGVVVATVTLKVPVKA